MAVWIPLPKRDALHPVLALHGISTSDAPSRSLAKLPQSPSFAARHSGKSCPLRDYVPRRRACVSRDVPGACRDRRAPHVHRGSSAEASVTCRTTDQTTSITTTATGPHRNQAVTSSCNCTSYPLRHATIERFRDLDYCLGLQPCPGLSRLHLRTV